MVRTKADNCAKKAVAAKATRKVLGSSNSGGSSSSMTSPSSSKAGRYVGGNPVCVRSTPEWQKGISAFMRKLSDKEAEIDVENQAGVEVTDDVAAADNGESSQASTSSSATGVDASDASTSHRNNVIDSDED